MTSILVLVSLVTPAFAAEPAKGLPLPAVGATVTISDCTMKMVAAPWNTKNAGKLVIDEATAQRICLQAKGDLKIAEAQSEAIKTRAESETQLMGGLTIAAMNGDSVSYTNGDVHMASGNAAEWHEYGTAISTGTGYTGAMYDPRFVQPYVLDQGRAAFMAHPAVPGGGQPVATTADTASCGTAAQCEEALKATRAALAKADN